MPHEIRIPRLFKFVLKYVTPLYILAILIAYLANNFDDFVLMKSYGATWKQRLPVLGLRLAIFALVGATCYLIAWSWKRHPKQTRPEP